MTQSHTHLFSPLLQEIIKRWISLFISEEDAEDIDARFKGENLDEFDLENFPDSEVE